MWQRKRRRSSSELTSYTGLLLLPRSAHCLYTNQDQRPIMRFIQRQGTVGTVTFEGEAARLLKDGVVVRDWTTGGVLIDVPQGDGYTLEVSLRGNVTRESVAIGVIVAGLGQSNMQLWFRGPTAVPPAAATYQLQSNGSWGEVQGAGARTFTSILAAQIGAPVAIVNSAVGGTALTPEGDKGTGHWLDRTSGSLYANAVARIDSVGGQAEFVLWMQGETDASAKVPSTAYAAALSQLMGSIGSDFGDPHILIGALPYHGFTPKDVYAPIRLAQHQIADASTSDTIVIGAGTTDLETMEGVHLSGAARVITAERMAATALRLLGLDAPRILQFGTSGPEALFATGSGGELFGLGGNDSLNGDNGSDVLFGGEGDDALSGADGNDIVRGELGNDTLMGGNGIDVLSGGEGDDWLSGGAQPDELWGDRGNDTLDGGAGDDLLVGGLGDDTLIGGEGEDTVLVSRPSTEYAWHASGNGFVLIDVTPDVIDDGTDTLLGVEVLQFSDRIVRLVPAPGLLRAGTGSDETLSGGDGPDTLRGVGGNDSLIGGLGDDSLEGGEGNDTLDGGAGLDTLRGGLGNDTYRVDSADDRVIEAPGEGTDTVASKAPSYTLPPNVEKMLLNSGTGIIEGIGNELANSITGNASVNRLSGMAGNDTLTGAGGDDTLHGGEGVDMAAFAGVKSGYSWTVSGTTVTVRDTDLGDGDDGVDTLTGVEFLKFSDQTVALPVPAAPGALQTGTGGDETLFGGDGADTLLGTGGNDSLIGALGNDSLKGGEGNDTLDGGAGADTLSGGIGNDTFRVDSAADVIVENAGEGTDTVASKASSYTLPRNVEKMLLNSGAAVIEGTGNELANSIVGNGNANRLSGMAGNDTLSGADGDDTLIGGTGADYLTGGTGADVFVFAPGDGGPAIATADRILDFHDGVDRLHLSGGLGFEQLTFTRGNYVGGSAPDTVVSITSTGEILVVVEDVGTLGWHSLA